MHPHGTEGRTANTPTKLRPARRFTPHIDTMMAPPPPLKTGMKNNTTRTPRRSRATHNQEEKVKTWLSEAQDFVDQYKLSEAEQRFWQVGNCTI